jgi:hypothetical protein
MFAMFCQFGIGTVLYLLREDRKALPALRDYKSLSPMPRRGREAGSGILYL